jgi:hypothetical protein
MSAAIFGAANFCGASGASYQFQRMGVEQDWAKVAGVVLFAAQEGRSWRIIRVGDQGGVDGDVNAFWRWREARRYGATAVFVRRCSEIVRRRWEAADLETGLDPVFAHDTEQDRLAA